MASRGPSSQDAPQTSSIRRHSIASSSQSEDSSHAASPSHRRKNTRGGKSRAAAPERPTVSTSLEHVPSLPSQAGSQTGSRRASTTSMRTSSAPLESPVTYTPTTHRVSKAKKGKRVHACEFPGCNKVFTRAEHRRRHELNHSSERSYPCDRENCRKAFHRPDLLARHLERHDLDATTEGASTRDRNQISESSEPLPVTSSSSIPTPQAASRAPAPFSIPSIVNPTTEQYRRLGHPPFDVGIPQPTISWQPYVSSTDESSWDFSHESSQSPMSDYHARYPHRTSISSTPPITELYPQTSPLINTTMPEWGPPIPPPSSLPPTFSEVQTSGILPSLSEPPGSSDFSVMDGHEWMAIRRALSSDPDTRPTDDALGLYDSERWQHCLENYWRHFHPLFPIIHRPTLVTTSTPLLTCAMVAIGSQYDSREDAVEYSLALLEAILKLLSKRDTITSRSRLSDLQTVLLVEVLSKYRSRRANVQISPRFRTCYAGLTQSRQWLKVQPLSLFRSLRGDRNPDKLTEAQRFWADCEMKRRILQASFILDTQQAALFEQPPAQGYVTHFQSKMAPPLKTHDMKNEMPFPCSADLWDSSPVEEWAEKASAFEDTSLANATYQATRNATVRFDTFQTTFVSSYVVTASNTRDGGATTIPELGRALQRQSTLHAQFSFHAMLMARHAPIRQLLMVSGETWLLGKKVDTEAEYLAAKRGLRSWVDNQDQWAPALWHATQLLQLVFDFHHTSYEGAIHDRRLNMLHEEWSIYLAALICWAVGFDASQDIPSPGVYSTATSTRSHSVSHASSSSGLSVATAHPPLLDTAEADEEMKEYLMAANVRESAQLKAVTQNILGRTDGLLEVVRTRRLGGPMGELLNEAERVLYRLVEAKSRINF